MQHNQSTFNIQLWPFDDFRFIYLIENRTNTCPINSKWLHFEEYLFSIVGLIIALITTIKIHLTEQRFHDSYALFRCHIMNLSLCSLFLLIFLFTMEPNEKMCRYEQIFIQYCSTILLTNMFLMTLFRTLKTYIERNKLRFVILLFSINLILQTTVTLIWYFVVKKKHSNYHRRLCFHRIQIDLCLHAREPLLLSTSLFLITFLLAAFNVYKFTKPLAIAQLVESILSSIGLLMSGSMWYMNLFFSNHPQVPYGHIAFIFLLTYLLPRVWISELERSRITVEEIKPLLHDEVQYQNGNCTINFNNSDDEDDIVIHNQSSSSLSNQKPANTCTKTTIIRTSSLAPGEIFSSMIDKHNSKPVGYL